MRYVLVRFSLTLAILHTSLLLKPTLAFSRSKEFLRKYYLIILSSFLIKGTVTLQLLLFTYLYSSKNS
jgi:hypothetical protein